MATTTRTTGSKKTPTAKTSSTATGKSKTKTATALSNPVAKKTLPAAKKPQPVAKKPAAVPLAQSVAAQKPAAKKIGTKATATTRKPAAKRVQKPAVSDSERRHMIATAAYYLAERRGFSTGYEMQDWITAEAQIEAQLNSKR